MPTNKITKFVKVNRHQNILTLDPSTVQLEPGDWVQWRFVGMPPGTLPVIKFNESEFPFGPFQCLQSKPGNTVKGEIVQGTGNNGKDREYHYTAMLLDTHDELASGVGSVRNLATTKDTSPVCEVQVVEEPPENNEKNYSLHLASETLMLFEGDTAYWEVFDLPADCFISLLFTSGHTNLNPLVGPFGSLAAALPVEGEEKRVMRVVGPHFTPQENAQRYTYQIAIRDSSGKVLVSKDPVIDNLGQPPEPPGE